MTTSSNFRPASIKDIDKVVEVHLAAFPDFFLSQLGHRFLHVMYRAFLSSPASIFLVSDGDDEQIVGFAVGVMQGDENDRSLAVRFLPQFFLAVLPALFRHPRTVLGRLSARFFGGGVSVAIPSDSVVLRSIGVLPSVRGGKTASLLIEAFERSALERGASQICLTTDEENNERAQRFYRRNGFVLTCRFQQDAQRWMWLMSKSIGSAVEE